MSLLNSSPSVWLLFSMLATGWCDFFRVLRLIGCFLLELLLTLYIITAVEFTFVAFSVLNLLGNSTRLLWNATAITCEHIFLVLDPIYILCCRRIRVFSREGSFEFLAACVLQFLVWCRRIITLGFNGCRISIKCTVVRGKPLGSPTLYYTYAQFLLLWRKLHGIGTRLK